MYGAFWRRLPGPWPIKLVESAVLITGVVALLFVVVFPWLEPRLPFTDVTVDGDQPGADIVDEDNPTGPATPGTGGPSTAPNAPSPSDGAPILGAGSPLAPIPSHAVTVTS